MLYKFLAPPTTPAQDSDNHATSPTREMSTEASSAEPPPPPPSPTAATIASIHEDVLRAHVLTRLDGPALASAACASSQLRSLSSERELWANMCRSTWPSTGSPLVSRVISTFLDGPRSFFSDSYSLLTAAAPPSSAPGPGLSRLISAVDIRYRGDLILSRAVETDSDSGWFQCSPFQIDVLDLKDAVRTAIRFPDAEQAGRELGEGLRLSWVLIDPAGRRAMDLSSQAPVSVQRHWLTGELHARFATVVEEAGGERGSATEAVQCGVVVTCGGWAAAAAEEEEEEDGGGGMQVREVSLQVEDGDGMQLCGRDSLEVLGRAFGGRRRGRREREEGERRRRYEEFERRKRERKERKLRTEGTLDFLFVVFGVLAFALFWLLLLCR